jgi:hypothetical protein
MKVKMYKNASENARGKTKTQLAMEVLKKRPKHIHTNIRLSIDEFEKLNRLAKFHNTTKTEILKQYLNNTDI